MSLLRWEGTTKAFNVFVLVTSPLIQFANRMIAVVVERKRNNTVTNNMFLVTKSCSCNKLFYHYEWNYKKYNDSVDIALW